MRYTGCCWCLFVTYRVLCTSRRTRTRMTYRQSLTNAKFSRTRSTFVDDISRPISAATTSTTWPARTSQSPVEFHSNATSSSPTEYSFQLPCSRTEYSLARYMLPPRCNRTSSVQSVTERITTIYWWPRCHSVADDVTEYEYSLIQFL